MPLKKNVPLLAVWVRKAALAFAFLSGVAMLMMMLVGALDIIGTNVFARPVPAAFEFMATMMVVVVFFALSLAQVRRAHLRVEVLYNYMPAPLKFIADILQYVLTCIFFGLIAYFGWELAMVGYHQGEFASGIINFPTWPARFALAIGASLMALQCAFDLIGCVLGWPLHEDAQKPAAIL